MSDGKDQDPVNVDQNNREDKKKTMRLESESGAISTPSFISSLKDIPKKKTICIASFSTDSEKEKSLSSEDDQNLESEDDQNLESEDDEDQEIIRENLSQHSSLLSSSFKSPDISQELQKKTNSKLSTKRKAAQIKNKETEKTEFIDTPKTRKFCSPPSVIRREFELRSVNDIMKASGDNHQNLGSQQENLEPRLVTQNELRSLIRSEWINIMKETIRIWESNQNA